MRICFDIGLHLDSRQSGMSEREVDIRRMTLWACVIYDRYWSLFLGRPTTMKTADLEIYSLANQFERLGTCKPAGPEKSLNTKIYEALIDLMEIAGKIVENPEHRKQSEPLQSPDQSAYFRMATIDRELHNWAARLPQDLKYTEENRKTAPISLYYLHQQYFSILVLLHRPFARYDNPNSLGIEDTSISALDSHFSKASRTICTTSAVTVARIFWQHRQRFDGKRMFCIAMQHAGTAATALIAALAYIPDATDRTNNMQYLEVLHVALQDMAHAYQPAERMAAVVNAVMIELRRGAISPGKNLGCKTSCVPARRDSTAVDTGDERPNVKRRQKSRSSRPRAMNPPPTTARQHRASDASDRHSVSSQPLQQHSDFVMATPRTEGSTSAWPNVHGNESFQDHNMLPTPEAATLASVGRRNEWINTHMGSNDFPAMPSMSGLPEVDGGDIGNLEFLPTLLNEEDWSRWHSIPGDAATDLDGFPPRGRFQAHNFASPPMGGIMNG